MNRRVVSLGNAVVDVVAHVPGLPDRGGDVLATDGGPVAGGSGLRALAGVRGANGDAVFAGRIGTGPFGDTIRAALTALGIPAPLPPVLDRDSGAALTLVEPDGERTFVTLPGAEGADPGLEHLPLRPDDLVHVSGYGLRGKERAERILAALEALPAETLVLLDPGPLAAAVDPAVLAALLPRAAWWSGNLREAARAAGTADPVAAAAVLAGRMRRGAVVRCGADGCVLALRGATPIRLPVRPVRARDTNGAGDTHVGAFLAALAQGLDPVAAAERANRAAAAFVAG